MLKDLIKSNQDYNEIIKSLNSKYIQGRIISDLYLPKQNLVKQSKFGFIALDYVEDQFAELRSDVIKFIDKGILPNYPELYGILYPSNAYVDFFEEERVAIKISKSKQIKPELVKSNQDYLQQLKAQDSLLNVKVAAPEACSGLVLSIAPSAPLSRENFVSSYFFKNYLLKLVEQYGFVIDKTTPWLLKSNMQSPFVKKNYPTSTKGNYFNIKYHQIFDYYKSYLQYESDAYISAMSNPFQYSEYCAEKDKFVIKNNFIAKTKLSDDDIIDFIIFIMCRQENISAEQRDFIQVAVRSAEGLDNGQKLWYASTILRLV